jgi:uncharacterized protein
MPVALSYPGVYLEELPSGTRAITGVATSVAAFVGRALRGPADRPVTIKNFADFERRFGGLWRGSTMSYAVQHFFLNGGADARIIRVGNSMRNAELSLPEGDQLIFRTTKPGVTGSIQVAAGSGPRLFQLTAPGLATTEVSTDPAAANYVVTVLAQPTVDVGIVGSVPSTPPPAGSYPLIASGALAEVAVPIPRPEITFVAATPGAAANDLIITISAAPSTASSAEFLIDAQGGPGPTLVSIDSADGNFVGTTLAGAWPIRLSGAAPTIAPLPGEHRLRGGTDTVAAAPAAVDITIGAGTLRLEAKTADAALEGTAVTISAGAGPTEFNIEHQGNTALVSTDSTSGSFVTTVLAGAPWAIQVQGTVPTTAPAAGVYGLSGGVDAATATSAEATAVITVPVMQVTAADAGAWGNSIRVRVDYQTSDETDASLFNLIVEELTPGGAVMATETFRNISTSPSHRRFAELVVNEQSTLVDIELDSTLRPATTGDGAMLLGGSDGLALTDNEVANGVKALETADIFTLLCTPPLSFDEGHDVGSSTLSEGVKICQQRNALYLVDSPSTWLDAEKAVIGATNADPVARDEHVAVYFPRVLMPDMLQEGRLRAFAPCGVVAGIMARTDARRGIWKAPAGTDATALGVRGLTVTLTDAQQGDLNKIAVNCVRQFPIIGHVVWGARTWKGADVLASEWKYVPVRRLAMFIKETLLRNSKWIVFEPNDEPLWSQIRLSFGGFMHGLFRQGAFEGDSPSKAYFVKCDGETTTATDRNLGVVNIIVGFAPLKPAEFVVIKLQQIAGQAE